MPLVLLIIPTARPNVLRGNVTQAINSQETLALSKKVLVKITAMTAVGVPAVPVG